MRGIVAMVRTDGPPVDSDFATALTAALAVRGPDAQMTRCLGSAALGHALLRCGDPATDACQPLTIDRDSWIVADARLDDRTTLLASLDMPVSASICDAELLLRAFAKWDVGCLEHVAGDFAFAIWTVSRRRLVCARDQMGVKPLYYAHVGACLLVSSAIECLRVCPGLSQQLDELAVADFLLFGHTTDSQATTFHQIRRVPPAHSLTWRDGADATLRRYWEFPIEEPLYLKSGDYTEQVRALLDEAVRDRSRAERVSIFMSGGLDSTAIAATAARRLNTSTDARVHAFTFVFGSLIQDDEHVYAREAARHLRLPWKGIQLDTASGWSFTQADGPEPFLGGIDANIETTSYAEIARDSRVALNGEGADNALTYEWQPYLSYLVRRRRWNRLAADAFRFVTHLRRPPLLNTVVGTDIQHLEGVGGPTIPSWMEPLASRADLVDRWHHVMRPAASAHPTRPAGYFSLQLPLWQSLFESFDPSHTRASLDVRYPFLDLRLLRFLIRVPVIPWCREKYLLRFAFAGDLPVAIRRRSKAPLRGSPYLEKVRIDGLPPIRRTPLLEFYGCPDRVNIDETTSSSNAAEAVVRFAAFSAWLARLDSASSSVD